MNITKLQKQYEQIQNEINRLKETVIPLPLNEVEDCPELSGVVDCKIKNISITENRVEMEYVDPETELDMFTIITIDKLVLLLNEMV